MKSILFSNKKILKLERKSNTLQTELLSYKRMDLKRKQTIKIVFSLLILKLMQEIQSSMRITNQW